ncbi:MAG: flagellar biosynthesis protein FlhA [Planctomycetes bacterium]|nr:flagellar biosynthesis protein FlhA [Planctomycetota bacterium]
MATLTDNIQARVIPVITKHYGIVLPAIVLCLILVILIPLPTSVMDFLLLVNITLSGIVLLTVMYMEGPLEFSSFPSLLLSLTLFRLVLNIGTTRLILTNAHKGTEAAGKVVATFGKFVAGDVLMVGVIIFAIIVIIQFVVITKGATRIAEVAARFTLDGMPGKQMAIDADLNAGILNEAQAKQRREEITRESDFYGAMDGASKFVRGDAVAGIIITGVNILGGMYVGMVELDMSFSETLTVFTTLTIGDGLVSQIPAFIVSVAAGMIVTRSASKQNLGDELLGQLSSKPIALVLAACFLGVLLFTPLPKVPLLLLASGCGAIAYTVRRSELSVATDQATARQAKAKQPDRIEKYLAPDPMELEVGYGLIKLVDRKQGGDLLDRVTNMRRQVAGELGIVVPPIRIRDNIQLGPNAYVVKIKALEVGQGEVMAGHLLAIDAGAVGERLHGIETKEPAFGLPALWIEPERRHDAEHRNYTVVEPTAVLATHLTEVIKRHADELLTRQEVNRLLDNLGERSAKLVEELIPSVVKPGELQRVMQNLLRERVPVRDLETILETVGDWITRTKDVDLLTEYVRNALARTICHQHRDEQGKIPCVTLEPQIEESINAQLDRSERGTTLTMAPEAQTRIAQAVRSAIEEASAGTGRSPVVLCSPQVRLWLRRIIEPVLPQVAVLAYNEIVRGIEVEARGMVTLSGDTAT